VDKEDWLGFVNLYIEPVNVNKSFLRLDPISLSQCWLSLPILLQMLLWIKENRQEFLLNYTEIGNDTTSAEELEDEHQNFQSSCMVSEFIFQ